jgi:hypothetical protein
MFRYVSTAGLFSMLICDMFSGSEWALATFFASAAQGYSYLRWMRLTANNWKDEKTQQFELKREEWSQSPTRAAMCFNRLGALPPTLDRARGAVTKRVRAARDAIAERFLDIERDTLPAVAMYVCQPTTPRSCFFWVLWTFIEFWYLISYLIILKLCTPLGKIPLFC